MDRIGELMAGIRSSASPRLVHLSRGRQDERFFPLKDAAELSVGAQTVDFDDDFDPLTPKLPSGQKVPSPRKDPPPDKFLW